MAKTPETQSFFNVCIAQLKRRDESLNALSRQLFKKVHFMQLHDVSVSFTMEMLNEAEDVQRALTEANRTIDDETVQTRQIPPDQLKPNQKQELQAKRHELEVLLQSVKDQAQTAYMQLVRSASNFTPFLDWYRQRPGGLQPISYIELREKVPWEIQLMMHTIFSGTYALTGKWFIPMSWRENRQMRMRYDGRAYKSCMCGCQEAAIMLEQELTVKGLAAGDEFRVHHFRKLINDRFDGSFEG